MVARPWEEPLLAVGPVAALHVEEFLLGEHRVGEGLEAVRHVAVGLRRARKNREERIGLT